MAKDGFDIIKEWCSNTQVKASETTSEIARNILSYTVDGFNRNRPLTPVRTGRYTANWNIASAYSSRGMTEQKSSTAQTAFEVKSFITDDYFLRNESVVLWNSATYHDKVEKLGWARTSAYQPIAQTLSWAMNTKLYH